MFVKNLFIRQDGTCGKVQVVSEGIEVETPSTTTSITKPVEFVFGSPRIGHPTDSIGPSHFDNCQRAWRGSNEEEDTSYKHHVSRHHRFKTHTRDRLHQICHGAFRSVDHKDPLVPVVESPIESSGVEICINRRMSSPIPHTRDVRVVEEVPKNVPKECHKQLLASILCWNEDDMYIRARMPFDEPVPLRVASRIIHRTWQEFGVL